MKLARHKPGDRKRRRRVHQLARPVKRLLKELAWMRYQRTVLRRLHDAESVGLDFFRVAHNALQGDSLLRLVRILDRHRDAAAFWHLLKELPNRLRQLLDEAGTSVDELSKFSERLKCVRDRVLIHIDKDMVFAPLLEYRRAAISRAEIDRHAETLWKTLNALHRDLTGRAFRSDEYSGDDVEHLLRLRDSQR